jgi:hypothetical protein
MALIRVYQAVDGTFAKPTLMVLNTETGGEQYAPITGDGSNKPIQSLLANGHRVVGGNGSKSNSFGIIEAEGSNGTNGMARAEYADIDNTMAGEAVNIFIDNTSKTAAQMLAYYGVATPAYSAVNQKVVLFDGVGLIKRFLGQTAAAPLSNGVHFGGDFSKETYVQYAQTTQSIPIDFHKLVLTVNNSALFNQVQIESNEAKVNGSNPKSRKIDIQGRVTAQDFNNTVRTLNDFRFQANGLTGLVVTVPAEGTLSINMSLSAIGKVFNMMK